MSYLFYQRIRYFLKARHRKGHGIHSPFLFRLITRVIENDGFFSAYSLLDAAGENVQNMLRILEVDTRGEQSATGTGTPVPLIPKLHLLPPRFNKLLFRLVNDFGPRKIAFYGNTFGVTLLALALADKRIKLEAQVANSQARSFCKRLVEVYEVDNITVKEIDAIFDSDFVVVQNPQNPVECNRILSQILGQNEFEGLVVLCGIHTSQKMEEVWNSYRTIQPVRISLDLFEIGIYICKKGLQREKFMLRF